MPTNKSKDCDDNLQLEKSDFNKINPPTESTADKQIDFTEFSGLVEQSSSKFRIRSNMKENTINVESLPPKTLEGLGLEQTKYKKTYKFINDLVKNNNGKKIRDHEKFYIDLMAAKGNIMNVTHTGNTGGSRSNLVNANVRFPIRYNYTYALEYLNKNSKSTRERNAILFMITVLHLYVLTFDKANKFIFLKNFYIGDNIILTARNLYNIAKENEVTSTIAFINIIYFKKFHIHCCLLQAKQIDDIKEKAKSLEINTQSTEENKEIKNSIESYESHVTLNKYLITYAVFKFLKFINVEYFREMPTICPEALFYTILNTLEYGILFKKVKYRPDLESDDKSILVRLYRYPLYYGICVATYILENNTTINDVMTNQYNMGVSVEHMSTEEPKYSIKKDFPRKVAINKATLEYNLKHGGKVNFTLFETITNQFKSLFDDFLTSMGRNVDDKSKLNKLPLTVRSVIILLMEEFIPNIKYLCKGISGDMPTIIYDAKNIYLKLNRNYQPGEVVFIVGSTSMDKNGENNGIVGLKEIRAKGGKAWEKDKLILLEDYRGKVDGLKTIIEDPNNYRTPKKNIEIIADIQKSELAKRTPTTVLMELLQNNSKRDIVFTPVIDEYNYLDFIYNYLIFFKNKSVDKFEQIMIDLYYDIFSTKSIERVENEKFFSIFNDITKALTTILDTEAILEQVTRSAFENIQFFPTKTVENVKTFYILFKHFKYVFDEKNKDKYKDQIISRAFLRDKVKGDTFNIIVLELLKNNVPYDKFGINKEIIDFYDAFAKIKKENYHEYTNDLKLNAQYDLINENENIDSEFSGGGYIMDMQEGGDTEYFKKKSGLTVSHDTDITKYRQGEEREELERKGNIYDRELERNVVTTSLMETGIIAALFVPSALPLVAPILGGIAGYYVLSAIGSGIAGGVNSLYNKVTNQKKKLQDDFQGQIDKAIDFSRIDNQLLLRILKKFTVKENDKLVFNILNNEFNENKNVDSKKEAFSLFFFKHILNTYNTINQSNDNDVIVMSDVEYISLINYFLECIKEVTLEKNNTQRLEHLSNILNTFYKSINDGKIKLKSAYIKKALEPDDIPGTTKLKIFVPPGKKPGDMLVFYAGRHYSVRIPTNMGLREGSAYGLKGKIKKFKSYMDYKTPRVNLPFFKQLKFKDKARARRMKELNRDKNNYFNVHVPINYFTKYEYLITNILSNLELISKNTVSKTENITIFLNNMFSIINTKNNKTHYNNILFFIHDTLIKSSKIDIVDITFTFIMKLKDPVLNNNNKEKKAIVDLYCSILKNLYPEEYIKKNKGIVLNIILKLFLKFQITSKMIKDNVNVKGSIMHCFKNTFKINIDDNDCNKFKVIIDFFKNLSDIYEYDAMRLINKYDVTYNDASMLFKKKSSSYL